MTVSLRRRSVRTRLTVQPLEDRSVPSVVTVGGEFRVNSFTTGRQGDPKIATDQDGDFVMAWSSSGQDGSGNGVYAQRYNSAGLAQGGEFRVNTYTSGTQNLNFAGSGMNGGIAMDRAGDFVITWTSYPQDGSDMGVYAQRYNSAGVAQGGEFRVNTYTTGRQVGGAVAMDSAGDFVIAWISFQDGSGYDVYAQRYDSAGVAQGGEFRVNTYTRDTQFRGGIAMDSAGGFVVAWSSYEQEGPFPASYGIYAKRYNSAGVPQGGEFRVNAYTTGRQEDASIAMDSAGDFVIAWNDGSLSLYSGQDGSDTGIYARRYNSAGVAQGGEFRVNTYTTGIQWIPSVAMDSAGDFVIAWTSDLQDGSSYGVYAQAFKAGGAPDGDEFLVNTYTPGLQWFPSAAMDNAGDFVIAWPSDLQDGSSHGVYAQQYRLVEPPSVTGIAVNGGAAQRSRVTSLAVTFSDQVTFATTPAAAFTLTRNSDGAAVAFSATANVVGGVTVVTLNGFGGLATQAGSLADGRYTLTALASQISANGEQMASDYTFGDAQGLFRYYGDINGDRRVDISDFGFFSQAYLNPLNFSAAFDFNGDGRIDIADFGQFSARFFTTLP